MKKLLTIAMMSAALLAQGKVYTLADLATLVPAAEDGVGVSVVNGDYVVALPTSLPEGVTGIGYDDNNIILTKEYFTINGDLEINGETLRFAGTTSMEINGNLTATGAVFGAAEGAEATAKGFRMYKEGVSATLTGCTFSHVGINYGNGTEEGGFTARNCSFVEHNGKSGNSAINFTSLSNGNIIDGCTFTDNQLSSIASGANVACGIEITNNTFNKGIASTRLYPSINMSATGPYDIVVSGNDVHGPAEVTRAGGIALSCLLASPPTGTIYVTNNFVEDCSYGITLTGPGYIRIEDNTVLNNKYIANVNLGGSGINITCSSTSSVAKAYMRGNVIEGNVWGVTIVGNGVDVNAGKVEDPNAEDYNPGENIFRDNGNGDPFVQYDWYNNTTATAYAQGNTWSVEVQDAEHIAQVIVDKADNEDLGEVIYMPAGPQSGIAEISGESATRGGRYNLLGQPVDDNYRGIVIDGGVKRIAK